MVGGTMRTRKLAIVVTATCAVMALVACGLVAVDMESGPTALYMNGAPYFVQGTPRDDQHSGFPYYDNWVVPWSTYGKPVPNWIKWEPNFNPPGHMDWDPNVVNPPQQAMNNANNAGQAPVGGSNPYISKPYYAARSEPASGHGLIDNDLARMRALDQRMDRDRMAMTKDEVATLTAIKEVKQWRGNSGAKTFRKA